MENYNDNKLVSKKINEIRNFAIEIFENNELEEAIKISSFLCEAINVAIDQLIISYIAESDFSTNIQKDKITKYFKNIKERFDKKDHWNKTLAKSFMDLKDPF